MLSNERDQKHKKWKQPGMEITLLSEYGKKKLLDYADTIRDIAKTYIPTEEEEYRENIGEKETADRQAVLYKQKIYENREILANHLDEMAHIMTHIARDTYHLIFINQRKQKQIVQILKNHGILVKTLYLIQHKSGQAELSMEMRANRAKHFETQDVAGILSVILNRRLIPEKNCVMNIGEENDHYIFVEETQFFVETGIAKAVKENENMSGDNYSFCEVAEHRFICAISDGMGSGRRACEDSAMVIDLLEKLLEVGIESNRAISLINDALLTYGQEQNLSTLDLCEINQQSGLSRFYKTGAVISYIKRRNGVEIIEGNSLPLGIFHQLEISATDVMLQEGDYVIQITDGILEALEREDAIYILQEVVDNMELRNPRDIANYLLQYTIHASGGKIKDDMTVAVAGLWKNKEENQ